MSTTFGYVALPVVARRLRVSLHRAIAMIHAGHLHAKLVGHYWWVESASLEAALRARRRDRGNAGGGRAA